MSKKRDNLIWLWQVTEAEPHEADRADKRILSALESTSGKWSGPAPVVTRNQVQRWMENKILVQDGIPVRPNQKLNPGSVIRIELPPPSPMELVPEDIPIEILFEDEYLAVVNKPPRLTVHPSATQKEGTLVHALLHRMKNLSGIGGVLRPGIVHRIDKDTSGALVITKTDVAHQRLMEAFSKHDIERVYWALVYGSPKTQKGTITSLIGRSPNDRKKMSTDVKTGRNAITHFSRIEEYQTAQHAPFASWLEVRLETGRTHQVRVHLTSLGHSLMGDPVYGPPTPSQSKWKKLPRDVQETVLQMPGQALHARVLGFSHPMSGEKMKFEATPPKEFLELMNVLRKYR